MKRKPTQARRKATPAKSATQAGAVDRRKSPELQRVHLGLRITKTQLAALDKVGMIFDNASKYTRPDRVVWVATQFLFEAISDAARMTARVGATHAYLAAEGFDTVAPFYDSKALAFVISDWVEREEG